MKEKSTDMQHEFIGKGQCHLHPTHSSNLCYRCSARNPGQAAPALVEGVQPRDAQPGSAQPGNAQPQDTQPGGVQPGHTQGTF